MPYKEKYAFENMNFIAKLAHDMKTPVNAQIRAMELLYSGAFGKLSREAKNIILNVTASNIYLQSLLDNVLSDYRINNGNFILKKTKNDIRKTIEKAVINIGILFETKGQKIVINCMTDEFIKNYDEIEIQRVLINLLSNAFEYAKENSDITINVRKNSLGLNIEIKSRTKITENYGKNTKFDFNKSNCGLGLIICEKIINAHNGKIFKEIQNGEYIVSFCIP